jgi:hypothetical protein
LQSAQLKTETHEYGVTTRNIRMADRAQVANRRRGSRISDSAATSSRVIRVTH